MIELQQDDLVSACGGRLIDGHGQVAGKTSFPSRAVVDSRKVMPGDLFFGLPGENLHGGKFAGDALRQGAWGVVVEESMNDIEAVGPGGRVIEVKDPLVALGMLASRWRDELGGSRCKVVGITGSVGKTSTKDILACLAGESVNVHASPENYNTEVGLPLAILEAGIETECLVLEMAMRGHGQIRQLAQIAHPDVGLITNVGEAHVELLGSVEAVAEAKSELVSELSSDGVSVVPHSEDLLEQHLRSDIRTVTFDIADNHGRGGSGAGGSKAADVLLTGTEIGTEGSVARFLVEGAVYELQFNFTHRHNLVNATAAVAALYGLDLQLSKLDGKRFDVSFSRLRGEEIELPNGAFVINDCYNANPMSMRAALDHLADVAERRGSLRRVAVLGEMAELGEGAAELHRIIGSYAYERGVELLIAVGKMRESYAEGFENGPAPHLVSDADQAANLLPELIQSGDAVLVKGSRSVGLERVVEVFA